MAKIAMITDIHLGVKDDSDFFIEQQSKYYTDQFIPYLKNNNIKHVLFLGDTWDKRKKLSIYTKHIFKTVLFDQLENLGIDVYMIYGNHDVFFRNTNDVNSIDELAMIHKNITVIPEHDIISIDGCDIGMISWINNSNYEDSLKFIATAKTDILCGHFDIVNFQMVKGVVSTHGLEPKIFDRYEKVFSGHYHVISDDGRINYLGNPYQTNWGDYGLQKGFWVFDTRTRDHYLVENTETIYEQIVLTDDILNDITSFDFEKYRNKIVRVITPEFNLSNRTSLDLFTEKLSNVVYSSEFKEVTKTDMSNAVLDDDGNTSFSVDGIDETISKYIDAIDLPNENLDRVILKNYINEILVKVNSEW